MVEKLDNWKLVANEFNYQVYDSIQWKNISNNIVRLLIYNDNMDIYYGLNSIINVSMLDFNYFDIYDKNESVLRNCFNIADYICSLFCKKIL